MRTTIFGLLLALVPVVMEAQTDRPWEQYLNEVMTQEDVGSAAWEQAFERLSELALHPMDINTATREQLEELPFLTAQQIEDIEAYRHRYGRLASAAELQMIKTLDPARRRLLTYFIYIGEERVDRFPTMQEIMQYGRSELTATARVPFYRRQDEDNWLGPGCRHWLRYQYSCGDRLKAGLVGAQDAGEPFFADRNRLGYDYYACYLLLRRTGCIETLALGHYRVSMGMGLVMNGNFSLGKVATLQNLGRAANTIQAHASRTEGALRGAAATVRLNDDLRLTAFASYNNADATLNKDSTAATILTTGYHRTETELAKKHNLNLLKTGGSLAYRAHGLHLGLNALYTHLGRPLRPNTAILYRRHYPQGSDFMNLSLDYGYASPRLALSGETATDREGHLATINTMSLRLGDVLSLMALQRFYAYRYASLDAQSYSDGGSVRNESGIYLGLAWQPVQALLLTAYTDYAYFPWARYQAAQSSHAWDNLLQVSWQHHRWTIGSRYRLRLRQRDNEDKTALANRMEHRLRLSLDYEGTALSLHTQIDADYQNTDGGAWGGMVSQRLAYTWHWLQLNAGLGYFRTDGYDTRVYLYENGPLYTYALQQFYGEGLRYWLMARAAIGRRLVLTAKAGATSKKTDLDVQVRWKF